jgi:hypothetical protein
MSRMKNLIVEPHKSGKMKITRLCPDCKQPSAFLISHDDWYDGTGRLNEGATMQRAFPTLSPDQREILITGICNRCFDAITHD